MAKIEIKEIHSLKELLEEIRGTSKNDTVTKIDQMIEELKDIPMPSSLRTQFDDAVEKHNRLKVIQTGTNFFLKAMSFLDGVPQETRAKALKAKVTNLEEENQLADTVWEVIKKSTEEFHEKLVKLGIFGEGE